MNEDGDEPWFATTTNYVASGILQVELNKQQMKKFMHESKFHLWDDPFLYRIYQDKMIRRCVANAEACQVLTKCQSTPYGGHFG